MKKQLLIATILAVAVGPIFSQSYKSAGGLRLGGSGSSFVSPIGLTYCHFLFDNNSIEAIANLNLKKDQRFGLTALYKIHHKIIGRGCRARSSRRASKPHGPVLYRSESCG